MSNALYDVIGIGNAIVDVISAVPESQIIDFGLSPQLALNHARIFPNNNVLDIEDDFDLNLINELKLKGHKINFPVPPIGGGQMILIDEEKDLLIGASDWRKDGLAIGY